MFSKKILIVIAIALAGIALFGFVLTTFIIKKDNIQVLVAPRNASVKIDDKVIEANKPTYIAPGNYSLSITADKFKTLQQDITVTDAFQGLAFCLVPTDRSAEDYIAANPDDAYICEGAAGQAYNKEAQAAIEKYPIIAKLPYEDGTFAIGQGVTEQNEVAIYVHYYGEKSKGEALDWIHRHQKENLPPIIYTDDYQQTDRIGGIGSPIDKTLTQKYPIVKLLPIDAYIFRLGYRIDPSDQSGESIKLTIAADTPSGRMAALQELHARGYNPVDYKIEFINFESDLK